MVFPFFRKKEVPPTDNFFSLQIPWQKACTLQSKYLQEYM